jgi:ClpX C4-type zinc finger
LLAQARQSQERMTGGGPGAGAARADFHRVVRVLVSRSSRPGDVAAALGLSEQQVQEIVHEARSSGEGRKDARGALLACTFCGRSQRQVKKLIAGPGIYICGACIDVAADVVGSGAAAGTRPGAMHAVPEQDLQVRCGFCGKQRGQVVGMAAVAAESAGQVPAHAVICTECLALCHEIIAEELA